MSLITQKNILMIYFIQQGNDGPIKIGFTEQEDIMKRKYMLQTGNPINLHYLKVVDGNRLTERLLHEKFQDIKINGREWFYPTDFLLKFISSLDGIGEEGIQLNSPNILSLEEKIKDNIKAILESWQEADISVKIFVEKYMQEFGFSQATAYRHITLANDSGVISTNNKTIEIIEK